MTNPSSKHVNTFTSTDPSDVQSSVLPIMKRVVATDTFTSLPMPIQINNHLLCVNVCLGFMKKKELHMLILADSGVAVNSPEIIYNISHFYNMFVITVPPKIW